ncbi:GlxA family transcriptional regulator [Pseudoalteromonas sp. T1lg65]|uniref:GlxA family transcriptional regulator n=1 Tax=Pseudoalteromonas sp. T1lg65 TaxID=2077101 RepID=UPI003F78EE38
MAIKQVFFIADGFQALDLFGPLDAFMETNFFIPDAYQSQLLSLSKTVVKTSYGHQLIPDLSLDESFDCDDLFICGGTGMRTLQLSDHQLEQLSAIANRAKRVISICTGAFILAKLFPDEAISMTSHWRHCETLSQQSPNANVLCEPLYVKCGNKWSSAGVLSGVDLAFALIKEDHGNVIAAKVARELVVYSQRAGSQNQFSDMLQVQSGDSLKLSPLLDWLTDNVDKSITVNEMADYLGLSTKQLTRRFKHHLNCTPSHYFKKMKLNYARDILGTENISVEQVARKVGFNSYDSFRRAFYRQFSISPSTLSKGLSL